jgi:hypothetical protein
MTSLAAPAIRERAERVGEWLRGMSEEEREQKLVQAIAANPEVGLDTMREVLDHLKNGTLDAHIDGLQAQLGALEQQRLAAERDIKRLQALVNIHVPNDRPWMWALEMQFASMRLLRTLEAHESDDVSRGLCLSQLAILKRADAYAWSHDTATAAWLASQTIPTDTTATNSLLPGQAGWWWFEKPLPIKIAPDDVGLAGLLWGTSDRGLELSAYALAKDGPIMAIAWTWPHDTSWQRMVDDIGHEQFLLMTNRDISKAEGHHALATASRLFLAGCAWLQQRVVSLSFGHVERHRRKQLARENDAIVQGEVKVIQLRRSESRPASHGGDDGEAREWSCRWIVSGHWRNQPYKDGSRKLIYIMPFVKGPSDKPLKTAAHTVYQVSR